MICYLSVLGYVWGMRVVTVARFQSVRGVFNYLIKRQSLDVWLLYILSLIFEWVSDDEDVDDDGELFLWYGWPTKDV